MAEKQVFYIVNGQKVGPDGLPLGQSAPASQSAPPLITADKLGGMTAEQVDMLVSTGLVSGEDVYRLEQQGAARKGVLAKYAPKDAPKE